MRLGWQKAGIKDTIYGITTCSDPIQLMTYLRDMKKAAAENHQPDYCKGVLKTIEFFEEHPENVFLRTRDNLLQEIMNLPNQNKFKDVTIPE